MSSRRGFTMVEIMVVMAIIVVLINTPPPISPRIVARGANRGELRLGRTWQSGACGL